MDIPNLHSVLLGNAFQSIQVQYQGDQTRYDLIFLEKKKGQVTIGEQFSTDYFEELTRKMSKKMPVLLVLGSGMGIISKKVPKTPDYRSKILFNADPEEFYWYEYHQSDAVFVTVARQEIITKEIEKFEAANFAVIDFERFELHQDRYSNSAACRESGWQLLHGNRSVNA